MLTKCNCNNCSAHLEFEDGNAGETITCPTCGLETTLYLPQQKGSLPPKSKPAPPKKPQPLIPVSETERALNRVRKATCYGTLRTLIDAIKVVWIIASGIVALMTAIGIIGNAQLSKSFGPPELFTLFGIAMGTTLSIVLTIAAKQAALLLVDIADCQIQLAKKSYDSAKIS